MTQRIFPPSYVWLVLLIMLFAVVPVSASDECQKLGGCTLPDGACGVVCEGECLPFDEAKCCMAGMCYRNGSWCGGVSYNGNCLAPDEARCLMTGCRFTNGECVCSPVGTQ